jgi:hypothetical protein
MLELPRKAKGQRPVYLQDATVDKLLSMVVALAGEVTVLRERLDTVERLVDASGELRHRVDSYRPSAEVIVERDAWRARFLDTVLVSIRQEYEELEKMDEHAPYTSAIQVVTEG